MTIHLIVPIGPLPREAAWPYDDIEGFDVRYETNIDGNAVRRWSRLDPMACEPFLASAPYRRIDKN